MSLLDPFEDLPPAEARYEEPDMIADDALRLGDPDASPMNVPDGWPRCEVCDAPIEWSGRGRRPKKCAEHKTQRSPVGVRRGQSTLDKQLERLQKDLHSQTVKIGMAIGRWAPVTGLVAVDRADRFTRAVVRIAKDRPEILEVLEKVAKTEPIFEIAETVGALIFAAGVDMGRLNPESVPAQLLGITPLWRTLEESPMDSPQSTYDDGVRVNANAPQFGPGPLPSYTPMGVG